MTEAERDRGRERQRQRDRDSMHAAYMVDDKQTTTIMIKAIIKYRE